MAMNFHGKPRDEIAVKAFHLFFILAVFGLVFAVFNVLTGYDQVTTEADILINVNTAPVESLERLPGIGPALAAGIVEYRDQNINEQNSGKAFATVDDLTKVKGIGIKKAEMMSQSICFE